MISEEQNKTKIKGAQTDIFRSLKSPESLYKCPAVVKPVWAHRALVSSLVCKLNMSEQSRVAMHWKKASTMKCRKVVLRKHIIMSRRKLYDILRKIRENTSSMKQYPISVKNKIKEKRWFTNWPPYTKRKERPKEEADHSILMGGNFSKQVNL